MCVIIQQYIMERSWLITFYCPWLMINLREWPRVHCSRGGGPDSETQTGRKHLQDRLMDRPSLVDTRRTVLDAQSLWTFLSCPVPVLEEPSTHLPTRGTRSPDLNPVTRVEGPELDPDPLPPDVLQRRLGKLPKSRSADPVPRYTSRLEVVRLKHSL